MTNHAHASSTFAGWPRQAAGRVVGTLMPDILPDFLLADLSGSETKLLIYVLRHTSGYGKEADEISLAQFVHGITKRDGTVVDRGTGLSESTVAVGLKHLVEMNVLACERRRDPHRGDLPNTYRLRWEDEDAKNQGPPPRSSETPLPEPPRPPSPKLVDTPPRNSETQEATRQEATGQDATYKRATSLRSAAPAGGQEAVEKVWNDYLWALHRLGHDPARFVLTEQRRKLIARRIKQYGLERVRAAVRGWLYSPHHVGQNAEGRVWGAEDFALTLAVSDGRGEWRDNVQRFANLWHDGQASHLPFAYESPSPGNRHVNGAVASALMRAAERDAEAAANHYPD